MVFKSVYVVQADAAVVVDFFFIFGFVSATVAINKDFIY